MSKSHNYISKLIYKENRPDISRDGEKEVYRHAIMRSLWSK